MSGNAHQRRKARRAKEREPWLFISQAASSAFRRTTTFGAGIYRTPPVPDGAFVMYVPADIGAELVRALKGTGEPAPIVPDVPLIRGEIGQGVA